MDHTVAYMGPDTNTPLTFWALWGRGGLEGHRGPPGGVPGTPTYVSQNDPLVTLIILNTHM